MKYIRNIVREVMLEVFLEETYLEEEDLESSEVEEAWSKKYKDSINCNNPKGFSQRAHCQSKKKSKSVNENVGPGPNSPTKASTIYTDIFNRIFQNPDFNKHYDPDNGIFWFDDEYEDRVGNIFTPTEITKKSKDYRKMKKLQNWKKFKRNGRL